jgi:hypothetical protein
VGFETIGRIAPRGSDLKEQQNGTFELPDGGILLYDDAFLRPDVADRYFVELKDTSAWEQKKARFGQMEPRLTASYGDEGVTYYYSGTVNKALEANLAGDQAQDRGRSGLL